MRKIVIIFLSYVLVLERTVALIRFLCAPTTYMYGLVEKLILNYTLLSGGLSSANLARVWQNQQNDRCCQQRFRVDFVLSS